MFFWIILSRRVTARRKCLVLAGTLDAGILAACQHEFGLDEFDRVLWTHRGSDMLIQYLSRLLHELNKVE